MQGGTGPPSHLECVDLLAFRLAGCDEGFGVDAQDPLQCTATDCGLPAANVNNGSATLFNPENVPRFVYKETAEYRCNTGYTLDGLSDGATSFSLTCEADGLFSGAGASCVDVNECSNNNGGCKKTCLNSPGSFRCDCGPGYFTFDGGKSCTDLNECGFANAGCAHTCINTDGGFECSCDSGFGLGADGKACEKLGCGTPPASRDDGTASLTNAEDAIRVINFGGSVLYTCDPGWSLDGTSTGADTFLVFCQADQRLDPITALSCKDIDECGKGNGQVEACGATANCVNSAGGFACECQPGYAATNTTHCHDVDECQQQPSPCSNAATCENLVGSFLCNGPTVLDLLALGAAVDDTSVVAGEYVISGGGRGLALPSTTVALARNLTIEMVVRPALGTGGYLLSKSNADGTVRYLSVYLLQTRPSVRLWYLAKGESASRSVRFDLDSSLSDARTHAVMISLEGTTATLFVDGAQAARATLAALPEDCGAAATNCVTTVGYRTSAAGGTSGFKGFIRTLRVHVGIALVSQPAVDAADRGLGWSAAAATAPELHCACLHAYSIAKCLLYRRQLTPLP